MKKRITAAFLAVIMAFGLVACGPAENPDAILYEYTPYEFSPVAMPREIVVDQDMYDAWEYVIDKAMGDGAIFNGVPAFSMSKGYFRQETEKMGYEHMELTKASLHAKGEGVQISVANYSSVDEAKPIKEISVQFFSMDKDDFNPEILNEVNNILSLGRSRQVLGKSKDEMLEYLEISDLMLKFIKYFGGYWYKDDTALYSVVYEEGYDSFYNSETVQLAFKREENGRSQRITFSNVSGGPICSVRYEEANDYNEEHMETFSTNAKNWHTRENMVDLWIVAEKIENGTATAVDFDMTKYLELDWLHQGRMKVPVFADDDVKIEWTETVYYQQENPDEKLMFDVKTDNQPDMIMEYYYADDSIILKNEENTLAYRFKRIG